MSNFVNRCFLVIFVAMPFAAVNAPHAQSLDESLLIIEDRWATAAFETQGRQQGRDLKMLLSDVRDLHNRYPDRSEAATWHGVVARTNMEVRGSMRLAREARDALLQAESLDPLVFGGLVYANLGALYSETTSSFTGFGNKVRGIGYLWKAMVVDPDGIDSNFLYAEVLFSEKDYVAARDALLRASKTPVRSSHAKADRARKSQVATFLADVERRL
jgi:hypothetical protein